MKLGMPTNTGVTGRGGQQNEVVPWWVHFVGFFLPMPLDRLLRLPFLATSRPLAKNTDPDKIEFT